jgi:hypothetical protein
MVAGEFLQHDVTTSTTPMRSLHGQVKGSMGTGNPARACGRLARTCSPEQNAEWVFLNGPGAKRRGSEESRTNRRIDSLGTGFFAVAQNDGRASELPSIMRLLRRISFSLPLPFLRISASLCPRVSASADRVSLSHGGNDNAL